MAPMVALLLTVEATTTPVFANLSGLVETNEESIIVPCLEGVHCVIKWWGVDLGHHLGWGSVQLGRVDRVPIIPFVSRRLSVVTLCRLRWVCRSGRGGRWVLCMCQGIVLLLLQQCPQ